MCQKGVSEGIFGSAVVVVESLEWVRARGAMSSRTIPGMGEGGGRG